MPALPIAVSQTMEALCAVTQGLSIGTNLGLLHFLWMQVSGALLPHRGALFPALQTIGLPPQAIRHAWAAFRYGAWHTDELLTAWEAYVTAQGQWQEHRYEGYRPKAVDLTGYWRPALRGLKTKHYWPAAGKALPAVVVGLVARVGSVHEQRVALVTDVVRADLDVSSEATLRARVVHQVAKTLAEDEMPVLDAGFRVRELQAVGLPRYLVRLPVNFTARRNVLPAYKGHGRRPVFGELVRPLARRWKGRLIPATPPDRVETWKEGNIEFRAEF